MNKCITILMFQHGALKLHALSSYGLDTPLPLFTCQTSVALVWSGNFLLLLVEGFLINGFDCTCISKACMYAKCIIPVSSQIQHFSTSGLQYWSNCQHFHSLIDGKQHQLHLDQMNHHQHRYHPILHYSIPPQYHLYRLLILHHYGREQLTIIATLTCMYNIW